jgi:archaellum biogenesis protein FlaJ (TadC family)
MVAVLLGWLLALAIFLGFIVLLRFLYHRERMALITHGINPDSLRKSKRSNMLLRAGLITMMVGIALTIGLYPIGFILPPIYTATPFHLGPWLLPGLIPLAVGAALTFSYYLENTQTSSTTTQSSQEEPKVIPLKERRQREREEQSQ